MTLPILKKSGIYSFKNKLNGKIYIGQSKDVQTRKRQHERGDTTNSRRFHNAMVKYGPEYFEFQVLEYCEQAELDERESFWIEKLQSLYPSGYNLTTGGGAFQKHNEETKKIFRENQLKKLKSGTHIYSDPEFQKKQKERQIELGKLGLLPSQSPEFKAKRNATVKDRILKNGKFFEHSPDEIKRKRIEQKNLYERGLGKFQDPKLIENNRKLVKEKLAEGKHHTQQEGWTKKAIASKQGEMKQVVLCIRTSDGRTITQFFESINDAVRKLDARKKSISEMCNQKGTVLTIDCSIGKIIKGTFGNVPTWTQLEVESILDRSLTRKMGIEITIIKEDGNEIIKRYESQRSACRELDAHHRAIRYLLKGEKYNSTGCNLGRIVKVSEIPI
jgi:group I intron endonuclease